MPASRLAPTHFATNRCRASRFNPGGFLLKLVIDPPEFHKDHLVVARAHRWVSRVGANPVGMHGFAIVRLQPVKRSRRSPTSTYCCSSFGSPPRKTAGGY